MIQAALTDTLNLAALLKVRAWRHPTQSPWPSGSVAGMQEEPSVCDKPDAPALALVNKALGAKVEFRGVSFVYPASRDRIGANNDRLRAAESQAEAEACARAPSSPAALFKAARFVLVLAFVVAKECLRGRQPADGSVRLDDIESGTSPRSDDLEAGRPAEKVGRGGGRASGGRVGGRRGRGCSTGKDCDDCSVANPPKSIPNVLCDVSFTIEAGKTAALVRCAISVLVVNRYRAIQCATRLVANVATFYFRRWC
jgi:ABC-type multidrug transport system fused ATPase/permease subunit